MVTIATAAAQSNAAYVAFQPLPNRLPAILFTPEPLSGSLLSPFAAPDANSPQHAAIVPIVAAPEPSAEDAGAQQAEAEVTSEPQAQADTTSEAPAASSAEAPPPASETEAPSDTASVPEEAPPPPPAPPTMGKITVIVENVETDTGTVNIAVCDKGLSREGCPYVREVPAQVGFVETEFDDIPPGIYAVVSYHDVNGNNQFDKFLGMPREPYALSNHANDKLVPTFKDASLNITAGDNAVIIRLKRLGG